MRPWIGVDLDGTLAHHEEGGSTDTIGEPIPEMLRRVRGWLARGREVKIVTARVGGRLAAQRDEQREKVKAWCKRHLGQELEVTASKDYGMIELWDDRAVQVRTNTGEPVDPRRRRHGGD